MMETIGLDMNCAFCALNLLPLSLSQRQAHYEVHLQQEQPTKPHKANRKSFKGSDMKQFRFLPETDDFWHPGHLTAPPNNFTPGLILLLRHHLLKSNGKGLTSRAVLCYASTTHISKQPWDVGWGCGYRNFLMTSTALIQQQLQPQYRSILENPLPPSIRNLQAWLEAAWNDGFDFEAATHLGKIAGSRKWIGTSDLWVAYTYIGIPVQLIDFDLKKQPDGFKSKPLTDWVMQYFHRKPEPCTNANDVLLGATSVFLTDRMPLVLQRKGHSQTIVGYEVEQGGSVNLLIFDSSYHVGAKIRKAALEMADTRSQSIQEEHMQGPTEGSAFRESLNKQKELQPSEVLKHFRLRPKQLEKYLQYQLLVFTLDRPWTEAEKLERKVVTSTRVC